MSPMPTNGFMYGIDVPRFLDSDGDGVGDLDGVRASLPYIQSLGATWIWLLPFYPSPRRDNGYDVVDHARADPLLGGDAAFDRLVAEARDAGIRVLVDLVAHHTSDEHPWFRAVAHDPAMRERYVWAGPPPPADEEQPMFPGEQDGVWTFHEGVGRYYRHLFYPNEPDLNVANPDVQEEVVRIAEGWARRGVCGFRIDAAPHLVGTGRGRAELSFFDELCGRLRAIDPEVLIFGETDLPPDQAGPFVAEGRLDALLNFTVNNAHFLALARGDRTPLDRAIRAVGEATSPEQWINFLRNADELDLEQLTEAEREEVYAVFAPEERMRSYGRGIRRALAPMLGDDGVAAAFEELFAMPGLPLVMAGQEIGLGEELEAGPRDAVRLAMQWADAPLGGFSQAPTSDHVRPMQASGPRDWSRVNVAAQEADPDSLLSRFRAIVQAAARVGAGGGR